MSTPYKRVDNIDEKIHSVKLPYNAWKVLFVIGDSAKPEEIADWLDFDEQHVHDFLQRLLNENLIETMDATAAEVKGEGEPAPEEPAEESQETEAESEAPDAAEPVSQEEEDETDFSVDSFLEEMEESTETETDEASEEETEEQVEDAARDIEINIPEEEEQEEAETGELNVDFADQTESETTEVEKEEPAQEKEEEKPPKESPAKQAGSQTVLVIDDSIVIRKMVEIALENEAIEIATSVSGKEGLESIDNVDPDLVVLDLMLPDINGIEILKTIKASKGIPVIMLSGKDSPKMVEKAKEEGADAFLPKPFKDEELVKKIQELLGN